MLVVPLWYEMRLSRLRNLPGQEARGFLIPENLPFHTFMEELNSIKEQSLSISTQHANLKKDAEKKSVERNSRYRQKPGEINTVFQVHPDDFTLEPNPTHGRVMKSKEAVRNWKCKKVSDSKYEGIEERKMHAVFKEGDCHY